MAGSLSHCLARHEATDLPNHCPTLDPNLLAFCWLRLSLQAQVIVSYLSPIQLVVIVGG